MTKCKNSTAPIDIISASNVPCKKKCNFIYDFGNSSCSVTNMNTYLDILCYDGINEINYSNVGGLKVTNVRLFRNGITKYDGKKMDAELIIQCSGMTNGSFFICIPVKSSNAKSYSGNWFNKFIKLSPTEKSSGKQIVSVSNFSMNDIIPKGGFYYYEGTFPWSCNSNDKMIIFEQTNPINIKIDDYKILQNILSAPNYTTKQIKKDLVYNKIGTKFNRGTGGPGGEITRGLTCKPITDEDGNPLIEDKKKDNKNEKINLGDKIIENIVNLPDWVKIVLIVIACLIFCFLTFYRMGKLYKIFKNKKEINNVSTKS